MAFLSNLPLENNLVTKTLNARNPFEKVYDISGGYNTLTYLTTSLNKQGSKQVNTEKYEKSKRGNLNIATQISSVTASGLNLVINFSDPSYSLFRVGDTVMDTERNKAHVISSSAGTVTVEPQVTALNSATMFTAGQYCKRIFNSSPNRFSSGVTSIYNTPDLDYNYSAVTRSSVQLARQDFIDTYVKVNADGWWSSQQIEMVKDLGRQVEYKFLFSERGQFQGSSGLINQNGGLEWAIKNRGGTYVPSTAELTQTVFQDLIRLASIKNANAGQKLTLLYGKQALFNIQQFSSDFIKYAGSYNTFGVGGGGGLDIQQYKMGGVSIDFVPLPILDDPIMFSELSSITGKPRYSSMFFLVDTTPIPAVDGGTLPAIERFHFGNQEMYYSAIPGMIGPDGGAPSTAMSAGLSVSATDVDGVSCQALTQNGIDIMDAKNMLMFELAS